MADRTARVLAALAEVGEDGVLDLLDALLLAATRARNTDDSTAGGGDNAEGQNTEDSSALANSSDPDAGPSAVTAEAQAPAHDSGAPVWLYDPKGRGEVTGKQLSVGRATALPEAQEVGRALRPLRRPWKSAVHRQLDVEATVEHYTRTALLVPQFCPAPEPWLEIVLVVDRGTAMVVWDESVRALTKLLHTLSAFRDVRVWHLEHLKTGQSMLRDHRCLLYTSPSPRD